MEYGDLMAIEDGAIENTENKSDIDAMLPSDLLGDDEVVIFAIKPSLWSILFVSFKIVALAVIALWCIIFFGEFLQIGQLAKRMAEICGIIIIGRLGFGFLQWLSRCYVLTDRRLIRIRGVFTIDIFQCSLENIQNTFMVMTLPQRFLKLGNIELTTAGTSRVEAVWRHCRDPLSVHQKLLRAMNNCANGRRGSV